MELVYHGQVKFYLDSFVCIDVRYFDDWYNNDCWYISVYVDRNYHQRWRLSIYCATNEALDAARWLAESFKTQGLRTRVRLKVDKPAEKRLRHIREQYGEACTQKKAELTDKNIPHWSKHNPISRIAKILITEVGE